MRVRVSYTVEIDEQVWAEEYGLEPSAVRDDVRRYLVQAAHSQLSDLGLGEVDFQ